jgi:hypothetical protein
MVRSCWIKPLFGLLTLTGLAWTQQARGEQFVQMQEINRPAQQCRVLKTWRQKDGTFASQLQAVETGEIMTIIGDQPVVGSASSFGKPVATMPMSIFRWGKNNTPPGEAPVPTQDAKVVARPVVENIEQAPATRPGLISRVFGSSTAVPAGSVVSSEPIPATKTGPVVMDTKCTPMSITAPVTKADSTPVVIETTPTLKPNVQSTPTQSQQSVLGRIFRPLPPGPVETVKQDSTTATSPSSTQSAQDLKVEPAKATPANPVKPVIVDVSAGQPMPPPAPSRGVLRRIFKPDLSTSKASMAQTTLAQADVRPADVKADVQTPVVTTTVKDVKVEVKSNVKTDANATPPVQVPVVKVDEKDASKVQESATTKPAQPRQSRLGHFFRPLPPVPTKEEKTAVTTTKDDGNSNGSNEWRKSWGNAGESAEKKVENKVKSDGSPVIGKTEDKTKDEKTKPAGADQSATVSGEKKPDDKKVDDKKPEVKKDEANAKEASAPKEKQPTRLSRLLHRKDEKPVNGETKVEAKTTATADSSKPWSSVEAKASTEKKDDDKKADVKKVEDKKREGILARLREKREARARTGLPAVEKSNDDPLTKPEVYSKVKLSGAATEAKPKSNIQLTSVTVVAPSPESVGSTVLPTAPPGALGMQSVTSAQTAVPAVLHTGATKTSNNAFTEVAATGPPPAPSVVQAVPPATPRSTPAYLATPPQGYYQAPPAMPMMAPMQPRQAPQNDQGTPSGMVNAFTIAGPRQPVPADFGSSPQMANAFSSNGGQVAPTGEQPRMMMPAYGYGNPYGYAPPALAYAPRQAQPAPVMQTSYRGPDQVSLVSTLHNSIYPSEREMAADALAGVDARRQPEVVQALVTAARTDPAPLVRVGAVRSLARMRISSEPVITAIKGLKDDPDPRVRQAANQCLAGFPTK